ncbi:hypothetical protein C8F01DRAFT_1127256, partial [Mycena amicta]
MAATAKTLPNELWLRIFDLAAHPTLIAISLTSHAFHELSFRALLRCVVWCDLMIASRQVENVWDRVPERRKFVKSLIVKLPKLSEEDPHADIFAYIHNFTQLHTLIVTGTVLPKSFFRIMSSIPGLRSLTLSECHFPRALESTPLPHLQHLTLSQNESDSDVAMLNHTPNIHCLSTNSIAKLPGGLATQLTTLVLGTATGDLTAMATYFQQIQPCASSLQHLSITIPELSYAGASKYASISTGTSCQPFPRLKTLFAPWEIVREVALKVGSGFEALAVQNRVPERVNMREWIGKMGAKAINLQSLAVTLARWDGRVMSDIAEALPDLRRLEVLYMTNAPTEKYLGELGPDLSRLSNLQEFNIYQLPSTLKSWNARLPAVTPSSSSSASEARILLNAISFDGVKSPPPFVPPGHISRNQFARGTAIRPSAELAAAFSVHITSWGIAAPTLNRVRVAMEGLPGGVFVRHSDNVWTQEDVVEGIRERWSVGWLFGRWEYAGRNESESTGKGKGEGML